MTANELTIFALWTAWKRHWWVIALCVVASLGAAYFVIATSPKRYTAEAVVEFRTPQDQPEMSIGGLAALVGAGNNSDRGVALATMQSRQLLGQLVDRHKLVDVLFPGEREVKPTRMDAINVFRDKHLDIAEDPETGVLEVEVEINSPKLAADLANELVAVTDRALRNRAIIRSQRSYEYLKQQLRNEPIAELRVTITNLMEAELRQLALARTQPSFRLQMIDPAQPPRLPSWPRPLLLLAVAGVLGLGLGLAIVSVVELVRRG